MSAAVVRALLDALRAAGHDRDAAVFEAEFDAKGWHVDASDQARLLARLQSLTALPTPPAPASPAAAPAPPTDLPPVVRRPDPARALPQPPPELGLFADYAPWVATLPGAWELIRDVNALLGAWKFEPLQRAVSRIFVEHLGFEPFALDETFRLAAQQTLDQVHTVARHDDFHVIVVRSRYAGRHTSSFEPVFQLHPRCIIFALEREARLRVVVRRSDAPNTKLMGQRILRGIGGRCFPDDDLFVWAKRFSLLEPGRDDDGRALARRADDAVRLAAADLVNGWTSVPVDGDRIPGPRWDQLPDVELQRFLQLGANARVMHGLEAELRGSLLWSTRDGSAEVRYRGHRIIDVDRDPDTAIREARSTRATAELELEHRRLDGPELHTTVFTLPIEIAIATSDGTFVIDGEPLRFVPGLQTRRSPGSFDELEEDVDDELAELEDELEDDVDDETEAGADAAGATHREDPDLDLDANPDVYSGEGLVPLLRWSVGRKLRAIGVQFFRTPGHRLCSPGHVHAWLRNHCDARGRLRVTARRLLSRHLEPSRPGDLPTVALHLHGELPAWSCSEMLRGLGPTRTYPVAGARLGPAGCLAAPIVDDHGSVRLRSGHRAADHDPRRAELPHISSNAPWIAWPLREYADLPPGTLARPTEVARANAQVSAAIFTGARTSGALVLAEELCARAVHTHRWVVDLPAHPGARSTPEPLVKVGRKVEVGDAVVRFVRPWFDDPAERHDLTRVGYEIADLKRNAGLAIEAAFELEPHQSVLRCPSAARGRVTALSIVPVFDARGTLVKHRVTLETTVTVEPGAAVLEDGRSVELRPCGREDLPFDSTGEGRVDGWLVGPETSERPVEATEWVDGRTGEPIVGTIRQQRIVLLPRQPARPPDPCLRYRVLDGWGLPRSSQDPQLTQADYRLLLAQHPEQAEAIHRAMRSVHGQPPFAHSIFDLSRASHLPLPPFVPPEWSTLDADRYPAADYDPRRTALHRASGAPYRSDDGPWQWRCECAALTGAKYAQLQCSTCEQPVVRTWVGTARPRVELPFPILHPWRKPVVAALLGLTSGELEPLLRTQDCTPLVDLTRAALDQPARSLVERLRRTEDHDLQVALSAQLEVLEQAGADALELDDVWIQQLEVLSPRLLLDGYRAGAPDLLSSPLTRRYRRIQGLARTRVEHNPTLRRALWIRLQHSVDELFGEIDDPESTGTLLELWRRVWPSTAPTSTPIAVPGLFERCSTADLQETPAAELLRRIPAHEHVWARGILTPDGVHSLSTDASRPPEIRDADSWREAFAWVHLRTQRLCGLVALCLGIDGHPSIVAALRNDPHAAELDDVQAWGPLVLRELLLALRPPHGRPWALLRLLDGRPRPLPRDRSAAVSKVESELADALPTATRATTIVRAALARALTGFWQGPARPECPGGWLWSSTEDDVPSGFRRILPPLSSDAWAIWPGAALMRDPIRAASTRWSGYDLAGYPAWFGLPGIELPSRELLDVEVAVEAEPQSPEPEPQPQPQPRVQPEVQPQPQGEPPMQGQPQPEGAGGQPTGDTPVTQGVPEARVMVSSLEQWMQRQAATRASHVKG